jgi:hypothetical protein
LGSASKIGPLSGLVAGWRGRLGGGVLGRTESGRVAPARPAEGPDVGPAYGTPVSGRVGRELPVELGLPGRVGGAWSAPEGREEGVLDGRVGVDGLGRDGADGEGCDGDGREGAGADGREGAGEEGRDGAGDEGRDGAGEDGRDGAGDDGREGAGDDGRDCGLLLPRPLPEFDPPRCAWAALGTSAVSRARTSAKRCMRCRSMESSGEVSATGLRCVAQTGRRR